MHDIIRGREKGREKMMEKKCKNEDSPVSMKARTRRCSDDAPAARSFAGRFSAMIYKTRD